MAVTEKGGRVLCALETSRDPPPVLGTGVAERVPFARASQARGRGSPRPRDTTIAPSASPQKFLCNGISYVYTWAMKPPLFIRPLTDDERMELEADRRTADAFRLRRAQIVLASARGLSPKPIAQL